MSQRHHRIDIRRPVLALVGVLAMVAPFVPPLGGHAQAQVVPETVCRQIDNRLNSLDEPEDPTQEQIHESLWAARDMLCKDALLPETVCRQIDNRLNSLDEPEDPTQEQIHESLWAARDLVCQGAEDDDDEEDPDPPDPPVTPTTVPPIKRALTRSDDGLVREVARLTYDVEFGSASSAVGRAAVVLDTDRRLGYRIITNLDAQPPPPRVQAFDLDSLREGPEAEFDITLHGNSGTAGTGTDLVTAVGGGKLFLGDNLSRVHVIEKTRRDGDDVLVRDGSFAPPLPASTGGNAAPVGPHTAGDALQSIEQGRSPVPPGHAVQALAYLEPHGTVARPKLLVLIVQNTGQQASSQPHATYLAQWDVGTKHEDWQVQLSACTSSTNNNKRYRPALAVSVPPGQPDARDVLVGCIAGSARGEVWKLRLAGDGSGLDTQTRVAAVPGTEGFVADSGGRRLAAYTAFPQGQFLVGVDVDRRGGVYGAAQLSPRRAGSTSIGVDPASGRLYAFAKSSDVGDGDGGGLLVVDGRRQPLPQKFGYPELNPLDTGGRDRIVVDPAAGNRPTRVFVPLAGAKNSNENMVRVYEDRRPVVGNASLTDADRFTRDIDEEEGKTRVSTTGATSAYGVRVLLTGGLYNLAPTETEVVTGEILRNDNTGVFPACEPHDRELVLAEIDPRGTTLSNAGLNAAAVAARVDERTRQDLSRPAATCWPTQGAFALFNQQVAGLNKTLGGALGPANELYEQIAGTRVPLSNSDPDDDGPTIGELLGVEELPGAEDEDDEDDNGLVPAWPDQPPSGVDGLFQNSVRDPFPFHPATCSQAGHEQERPLEEEDPDHGEDEFVVNFLGVPVNGGPAPGFTALAACGKDGRSIVTNATAAHGLGVSSALSFESATANSRLVWKDDGGMVVVTEAHARGVDVLGVLRIGEVRARAVSQAAGRPGTANTSVTREWCGVVGLSGEKENRSGCQNVDDPEFQERLRQFNENILARRGYELRATPIDPELRQGTPGGALSALQKDRFLVAGESFLNNDGRSNVAAFELIETTDTSGSKARRSRHIYQLAGVEGSTSYNISPIPQFDFQPFGLPTFDGVAGIPPSASEVLAGTADRRTPSRVVGAQPAGSNAAIAPPPAGGLLQALGGGLRWLLRNPLEALKFMALLATAWALPLHLHEKRRMLATATVSGRN